MECSHCTLPLVLKREKTTWKNNTFSCTFLNTVSSSADEACPTCLSSYEVNCPCLCCGSIGKDKHVADISDKVLSDADCCILEEGTKRWGPGIGLENEGASSIVSGVGFLSLETLADLRLDMDGCGYAARISEGFSRFTLRFSCCANDSLGLSRGGVELCDEML